MKKIKPKLPDSLGKVFELGSLNINGTAKDYFKFMQWVGVDMIEGKDVDVVLNGHDVKKTFEKEAFNTIVCMNTLEHDDKFWLSLEGINHVLKKGGYFIFASPTYGFPIHRHPKDYYRFMEDSVKEVIFNGYEILDFEEVYSKRVEDSTHRKGWKGINPILCGLGRKL